MSTTSHKSILERLVSIVGQKNLITQKNLMADYSHDEFPSSEFNQEPLVVVKPENAEQISLIVKMANKEKISVTARGGGTGLCGGCIASPGGILISLERMNRILEVDTDNQMAVVEAGVLLMDFYTAVEKHNLFFPPHPGDETATIGGVIATNAGGSRAVKYGVIRNFIKGLEVVLPEGEIVQLGGKLLKNSTGYNLLQLIIGSEGTLGIVTKAIISLKPPPQGQMTLIAPFENLDSAIKVVPNLSKAGIIPLAVEFIDVESIKISADFLHKNWPCKTGAAHLMIIVDGSNETDVLKLAERIGELCAQFGAQDVFVAESKQQQKEILDIRSHIYETLKNYMIEVLDIVVPPSEIPGHVDVINKLSEQYNMWLPTFGHASDGNVHTHLMKARFINGAWVETPQKEWKDTYIKIRNALHADAKLRGGMVSGEHGIGIIKKKYLKDAVGKDVFDYMNRIKKAFDPNNILNPGKIL